MQHAHWPVSANVFVQAFEYRTAQTRGFQMFKSKHIPYPGGSHHDLCGLQAQVPQLVRPRLEVFQVSRALLDDRAHGGQTSAPDLVVTHVLQLVVRYGTRCLVKSSRTARFWF